MRVLSRLTAPLLLVGAMMFAPGALASELGDECSATVWDGTASQSLDTGAVDEQIQKLEKLGADVRVRTYDSSSLGFIDSKFEGLLASCESWQALDGNIKGGLIVYMLTPEESLFVSGPTWDSEISEDDAEAVRVAINEQSTDTEAILAGIAATADELDGTQATDSVVIVPLAIAGLLLLAVLVFVTLNMMRKRRSERETLATARAQLINSRDKVLEAIGTFELDPDSDNKLGILSDFELVRSELNTTDKDMLEAKVRDALAAGEAVLEKNISFADSFASNLDRPHTVEEYKVATQVYVSFLAEVQRAQQLLDDASNYLQELQGKIEQAPVRAVALRSKLNETVGMNESLVLDGFKTSEADVLVDLGSMLYVVERKIAQNQPGQVIGDLETVATGLDESAGRLTGLQTIRRELAERHQSLVETHAYAIVEAGDSGQSLEEMKASYAKECWSDLLADQSDAVQILANAEASLRSALQMMSMESQNWQQSTHDLDVAEEGVEKVIQITEAIESRALNLAAIKSSAPSEARELYGDIVTFQEEAVSMKGRQAGNLEDLRLLASQVQDLRKSLDENMPDYLSAAQQLQASNEMFASIKQQATRVHQAVIAAEQAAERRIAQAKADRLADAEEERQRRNRRNSGGGGMSFPSTSSRSSSSSSSRRSSGTRSSSGGRKSSGRRR